MNRAGNQRRVGAFIVFCLILFITEPCLALSKPRLRISDYFGAPGDIDYLNPEDIGPHCYDKCREEKVGIVYTRRAGFFDIGHVREAADRTRYAIDILDRQLMRSDKEFYFRIIEPSMYYITVTYPDNWKDLDKAEKKKIAEEVSICFGQYLGHQSLIWHELLTWFGYASSGLFPEQISSFSWEDPYSDVVGTHLAAEAVRSGGNYDKQITRLLAQKMKDLEAEPAHVGVRAGERVRDKWYTGSNYFFVKMKKRSFDVGFDDGLVTPWLVPGMFPDAEPLPCPASDTACLKKYGFKIEVLLDPRAREKGDIYKVLGLDKDKDLVKIDVHFPELLEKIRKQARKDDGPDVDKPTL